LTLDVAPHAVWRRHDGHVGHGFRREPDNASVDLGIDAPKQRSDVEIEQGAVGRDNAIGLRPWWKRIEGALL